MHEGTTKDKLLFKWPFRCPDRSRINCPICEVTNGGRSAISCFVHFGTFTFRASLILRPHLSCCPNGIPHATSGSDSSYGYSRSAPGRIATQAFCGWCRVTETANSAEQRSRREVGRGKINLRGPCACETLEELKAAQEA